MYLFLLSSYTIIAHSVVATPLDDYVNRIDHHYQFHEIGKYRGSGYTNYILNMTSQKWKSKNVSTRPIWWHYLTVTIPDNITFQQHSLLFIDGDSNQYRPEVDSFDIITTLLAVSSGFVSAHLKMIPNEPIQFMDDPKRRYRSEDAAIAWTFKMFLDDPSDPDIILQLPMTKASVRAMDTVTKYVNSKRNINIEKFIVSGASKRGWVTWLTAAVDSRVVAFAPIVFDLLNMTSNLHHYYRSLGGWSFAFKDYYDVNYPNHLDSKNNYKLTSIIDPLRYNDRYTDKPKFIIKATGDEFFFLDNTDYYFQQLKGLKYLRVTPNAEHTLIGHRISVMFAIRSFVLSTITKLPYPQLKWKNEKTKTGGRITLWTDREPKTIDCHYATTIAGTRRDFRLFVGSRKNPRTPYPHPVIWFSDKVKKLGHNTYVAEYNNPPSGWFAFLIQVTFDGLQNSVLEFTTDVNIIPNTFPYPDCHGHGCHGRLL